MVTGDKGNMRYASIEFFSRVEDEIQELAGDGNEY
jgi:hypothetical protein